jgi:hypothetical protein
VTVWQAARLQGSGGQGRSARGTTLIWLLGLTLCCAALAATATATAAPPMGGGAGCVPPRQLGVVFVVDDSGSNDSTDPTELRRDAALTGIASLPTGSVASVSTFAGTATTPVPTSALTDASRAGLLGAVRDMPLTEQYTGTDYQAAFTDALAKLGQMGTADKRIVVFLTDGEPTEPFTADAQIAAAGVPIFSLGYGSSDQSILDGISARSGGKLYRLGGPADARSAFADIIDTLTCRSVFDPRDPKLPPGGKYERGFQVGALSTYFRATVSWDEGVRPSALEFVRPDGTAFPLSGPAGPKESLVEGAGSVTLTVDDPAVGNWKVRVTGDPNRPVKLKVEGATASDLDPGQCPPGVQGEQKVTIGEAVAYGCFQKDAQGRHTTAYPARIGGFDADPDNDNLAAGARPNLLILDTARRRIDVVGKVHLGLGGALLPGDPRVLPVGRKEFEFALDKKIRCKDRRRKRNCEWGQRPSRELEAADAELWGFAVAGKVKASWSSEGNGGATLELSPSVDGILRPLFSKVFKTKEPVIEPAGSGGSLVKAGLKVESTNDNGFQLGLSELTISPFKLVDKPRGGKGRVTARWTSPVGISARGERKSFGEKTGNLWTFEVIIGFPRAQGLRVQGKRKDVPDWGAAGRVYVFDGELAGGGAGVSGLNMPIGSSPVFLQRVSLDLLLKPGFGLRGEVGLTGGPKLVGESLVEGDPVAFGVGTLAKCETAASDADLPFEVSGTVTMPAARRAGADHELTLKVCYIAGDNALEGEFGAKFLWLDGSVGVQGSLKGWVDDSKFNIDGEGQIVLPGLPDPNGSLVVSSVGIGGCGGVAFFTGGVAYRWGDGGPNVFRGCDLGPWRQERPAGAAVAQAAQADGFTVNRHVKFIGLRVRGEGGAPVVRVTGPNGETFDSPSGPEGVMTNDVVTTRVDALGQTFVFIRRPARGRWTVTQTGGAPIAAMRTTLPVARPRVRAKVTGHGARRTLRYRARRIPGQRITFMERGRGVAHRIGTIKGGGRGRLRFRAARHGSGRRRVVAQVTQDGVPRANLRGARYRVRTHRRPGRVRRITLRRTRSGARVGWTAASRARSYYVTVRYRGRTLRRGMPARRRSLALGDLRRGSRVRVTVQAASRGRTVGRATTRRLRVGR